MATPEALEALVERGEALGFHPVVSDNLHEIFTELGTTVGMTSSFWVLYGMIL